MQYLATKTCFLLLSNYCLPWKYFSLAADPTEPSKYLICTRLFSIRGSVLHSFNLKSNNKVIGNYIWVKLICKTYWSLCEVYVSYSNLSVVWFLLVKSIYIRNVFYTTVFEMLKPSEKYLHSHLHVKTCQDFVPCKFIMFW